MDKHRYWEKVNALPCDISLPSIELYINEIDWNSHQQEDCDLPDRNDSYLEEEHTILNYKDGAKGGYQGCKKIFLKLKLESIGNPLIGVHLTMRMLLFPLDGLIMVKMPQQMNQFGKTKVLRK